MPIRPENLSRYPPDWKAISARIRFERAGGKCEWCKAPHGEYIVRSVDRRTYMLFDTGQVFDAENGTDYGRGKCSEYEGDVLVKVILTVAHLDQTPENCDESNLAALCQRCHNTLDAPHRQRRRKERLDRVNGQVRFTFE